MTAIEQAIKEAVEKGGWSEFSLYEKGMSELSGRFPIEAVFLDPLFWIALGKARDWPQEDAAPNWLWNWHDFINHLADGKNAEEFFKNLL